MEQAIIGIGLIIIFIVIMIRLIISNTRHKETVEKLDELKAALSRIEQAQGEQEQGELEAAAAQFEQVQRERDELKAALSRLEQAQWERRYTEDTVRPRKLSDKPASSTRVRSTRSSQLPANRR